MARLMTAFGSAFRHQIIALDGVFAAQTAIGSDVDCMIISDRRASDGNLFVRLLRIGNKLRRLSPDLLVTYNWGAMEWVMANRLLARLAHLHHEAGFSKEEADRQLPRRVHFRRLALGSTGHIVVPSRTLQRIAVEVWRLPPDRVLYVPNGIDVKRFSALRAERSPADTERTVTIGTLAPLRPEKNIGRLLHAFAFARERLPLRLLIAGEGSERSRLEALARDLGITESVVFLGSVEHPETVLRQLDVLALSSDTEQMPNAVLEAMAAALPVASPDVGDVRVMLAPENEPFIVARNDAAALGRALLGLAEKPQLRRAIGLSNFARVQNEFSHAVMVERWQRVLGEATRSADRDVVLTRVPG